MAFRGISEKISPFSAFVEKPPPPMRHESAVATAPPDHDGILRLPAPITGRRYRLPSPSCRDFIKNFRRKACSKAVNVPCTPSPSSPTGLRAEPYTADRRLHLYKSALSAQQGTCPVFPRPCGQTQGTCSVHALGVARFNANLI